MSDQPTDKPVLLIGEKSEEGVFELRDVRKPDREKLKKAIRRGMPLRDNLRRDDTRRPAKPEVIREVREVIKDDPELREKVIHRIQMDKNERGERIDV